ncbi:DNA polymerase [Haliea sp. E17]|uniref:DNA polymerase n=1 Tax=Haliea sp. E17 TaxID=3401576 RepID=UPI003AAE7A01
MDVGLHQFDEVWLVDFEFIAPPGHIPRVVCLVAHEWYSGRTIKLWEDELRSQTSPPYSIGEKGLFVAYYASAELGCHLALGWGLPVHVLDLYVEFRNLTNGYTLLQGSGLLGALAYHGLPSMECVEKEAMRDLILGGGPWTTNEKAKILDYCESDVLALGRLLPAMLPALDLPRSIYRGRYMKAVAHIERNGIPLDAARLTFLRSCWDEVRLAAIKHLDKGTDVYEGSTFKLAKWIHWLRVHNIPWPTLASGQLDMSDETFDRMAQLYPEVAPIQHVRGVLAQLRLPDLAVGPDERNRCLLSPYRSRTGRNQPSNSHYIFGAAAWLRTLIRPLPGMGIAYIDWSQQEFGIAAALSGDALMAAAYRSGDPYLAFAIQAGAAPKEATKETHGEVRALFKACVLAVQYGMSAEGLAKRLGVSVAKGRELLSLHRTTYRVFWRWLDGVVDYAMLHGRLWTRFGWTIHVTESPNPRFLQNFLMQANGAEMLRLACCLAVEQGIKVCATVHDAVLIEAPIESLQAQVASMQGAMREASIILLDGFPLETEVEVIESPNSYHDARGDAIWSLIGQFMGEL